MRAEKWLYSFFLLGALVFFAQNTNVYLGPHHRSPGNAKLVRVQVLVSDSPDPAGVQIVSAIFNEENIPLKPRDIYGFRGQASFQLPPDKYQLIWTVQKDKFAWPRTITHKEKLQIAPNDMWIQIEITGDQVKIQ